MWFATWDGHVDELSQSGAPRTRHEACLQSAWGDHGGVRIVVSNLDRDPPSARVEDITPAPCCGRCEDQGVAAGFSLVFIISLGFFVTPALLGALEDMTVSMLIENQVGVALNWGFAAAIGVILLITTTVTIAGALLVLKVVGRTMASGGVRLIGGAAI